MPDGLIGIDAFRAELRAQNKPAGGVFRVHSATPKAYDDGTRRVRFIFSDSSVDRVGDTIDAAGWELEAFLKNPVALWAHDSSQPPIGRASNVFIEGNNLSGDIEFAKPETYAFAETIYLLLKDGYINAVSVGFLPLEYDWAEDDDNRPWGIDFKRQELLEISIVPVPANSNALATARSKGIDTRPLVEWAERTLESGGKLVVPKAELDRLRKAAKPQAAPQRRQKAAPATPAPATPAAPAPATREPDGMGETDPAAGGALVATCGRPADQTCGLKDPAECSVHAPADIKPADATEESERMTASIRRAVRDELRTALKTQRRRTRRRADGEGSDAPPVSPEVEERFRAAHAHLRAAEDFYAEGDAHHDKALDLLDDIKDAIDANVPEAPENPEEERAACSRIADIRARHGV